jgi:sulfur-oxidizing protein SoxX
MRVSRTVLALGLLVALPAAAAEVQVASTPTLPSLTGQPGNPANGRVAVIKKGTCLSCHVMPIPEEADHGKIGPDLHGVASRYTEGELRQRIVDPKVVNPDTIMIAFHKTEGLRQVAKAWQGKPILTAQEVEDVVAYLMTLK